MRLTVLVLLLLSFAINAHAQESSGALSEAIQLRSQHFQQAESISLFTPREVSKGMALSVAEEVAAARFFNVEKEVEVDILTQRPEVLKVELPLANGESVLLKLYKRNLYAEKSQIKVGSTPEKYLKDFSTSVHYWGVVEGEVASLAAFSFSSSGIMGMFSFDHRTWDIGRLLNEDEGYVMYEVSNLKKDVKFKCEVGDSHLKNNSTPDFAESTISNPENCVRVYVEVDYDIFLNKGSDTAAAANYAEGAFNEAFILYANEFVNATISEIFVWDVPSPYSGNGSGDYLNGFRDYHNSNGGFNGDIAHLVNLENYGGVAWLDVLCNSFNNYAYSGINSSYQQVPAYSWTVKVIAHEMGHNIGSRHTHDCVWNGNNTPIDCCGPEEGYDGNFCGSGYNCNLPLPTAGTVMSYCHLVAGVGVDLNEGFHPQVGALLQDKVYNSSCLTPCPSEPLLALFEYDTADICEGNTITFTDQSTGGVVGWEWTFPGGTPSTSTDQNPTVVYDQEGEYDVTLVVTDFTGDTSSLTISNAVTVVAIPVASYTYDITGNDVIFSNTSTSADSYSWSFGDGNTSTLEHPFHTYTQDGTYQAELTAFNFCGTDEYVDAITISTPPIADMTATHTEGCAPLETTFDATLSYNATSYYWEFEGGNPSVSYDIFETVTYDSSGSFDVLLVASNPSFSDTLILEEYITIDPLPQSSFNYSINGQTVEFENTSSDEVSLLYNFGDGDTSELTDPVHTYDQAGTYTVSLTCINDCGQDIYTEEIEITTLPSAAFTATDTMACVPMEIIFDATSSSTNSETYQWSFEGGSPAMSSQVVDTIQYNTAGTFDVELIVGNADGYDTLSFEDYIHIQAEPEASFVDTENGLSAHLTNTSTNYDSIYWDFGDGQSSTDDSVTHTYTQEGIYTVTLIAINECSADTFSQQVSAFDIPQAAFSIQGESMGCSPLEVQFTNTSDGTVDNYAWTFEGGIPATSSEENPIVVYDTAGVYPVELTVSNSSGESEILKSDYIVVKDIPTASFDYSIQDSLTVSFEGSIAGDSATTIRWELGNGQISNQLNVIHTYEIPDSYEVLFIASNECGSDTSAQTIDLNVTSVKGEPLTQVRVYPNPANTYFIMDHLPANSQVKIVNPYGQQLFNASSHSSSLKINVASWPAGVYYLSIDWKNATHSYRVVIQ